MQSLMLGKIGKLLFPLRKLKPISVSGNRNDWNTGYSYNPANWGTWGLMWKCRAMKMSWNL